MEQRNILNKMWGGGPSFKGALLREDWELQRRTPLEWGGAPGRAQARRSSTQERRDWLRGWVGSRPRHPLILEGVSRQRERE